MKKYNCLLIGAGYMANEYANVLDFLSINYFVISRSKENLEKLMHKHNIDGFPCDVTMINNFVTEMPSYAIIAVSVDQLYNVAVLSIKLGIKNILLEKPAGLSINEILELNSLSQKYGCNLYIAYNRRFYSSVQLLKEILKNDGGIISLNFEFTEWVHTIDTNKFSELVLSKFLLANSTHVIDLVFHLIGSPEVLHTYVGGSGVSWHPAGSIFMGTGVSNFNIPFSYSSNWGSAGRWSVEILTSKARYYLKPLEELQKQNIGSIKLETILLEKNDDLNYKPGILNMINSFLKDDNTNLCSIKQHLHNFPFYEKIAGY
jgi:predicted dehydrogenase